MVPQLGLLIVMTHSLCQGAWGFG